MLLVNCDDFGMYPAINAAVIDSIEEGIAGSCSLMVPCPGAPQAMRLLGRRPQIPFGIHLTMVCEMPGIRRGPLSVRERVASLLDPAGKLFSPTPDGRAALLVQGRLDEIELEFRAQIDAVADTGLTERGVPPATPRAGIEVGDRTRVPALHVGPAPARLALRRPAREGTELTPAEPTAHRRPSPLA